MIASPKHRGLARTRTDVTDLALYLKKLWREQVEANQAATLCDVPFDLSTIPLTREAALASSCTSDHHPEGARPQCWFKQ